jgi:ATP-binding cassette subfamily F protein uup
MELEALPKLIEKLEAEQTTLTGKLADPLFFRKPPAEVTQATARLHEIEAELAKGYKRWEALGG